MPAKGVVDMTELSNLVSESVERLRRDKPLVQCLTNIVVANFTANVLLAAGAVPAMVDNPEESEGFASVADGVLVNTGTPYRETAEAMVAAVRGAAGGDTPWVLDPVGVGMPWRTQVALDALCVGAPAVIRANASEVLTLAGTGASARGPEAGDAVEDALGSAADLVRTYGTVVAISGPVDHIMDVHRHVTVSSGHEWMARVTGVGCSLGALTAAFAGVQNDHLIAAASATAMVCVAAERAADHSVGPGGFAQALIDELFLVSPDEVGAQGGLRDVTS
ncbi:hydroxyethylthiazole kinase [Cutibacterium sp. V970]|uniref:hydroxyethylthiazole kinase n=1 Tax=Cutibacterium sp. V970 TaxID=3446481 RepID=UPI003EE0A7C2